MNRKGFTLIELIAMMTVLGILMAIAVPNISGILKSNKENIQVEDINKMIETAKEKFKDNEVSYPRNDEACTVLTLKSINENDDFTTGVNGGDYDEDASYIVVKREDIKDATGKFKYYQYKYYVRLVERKSNKYYAMGPVDYETFTQNPKKYSSIRVKDEDVTELTEPSINVKEVIKKDYGEDLCLEITSLAK